MQGATTLVNSIDILQLNQQRTSSYNNILNPEIPKANTAHKLSLHHRENLMDKVDAAAANDHK